MTEKQYRHVLEVLKDAAAYHDLSDFETTFVADMLERLAEYGRETLFSPRQLEVIDRIEGKIYRAG